MSKNILLIEADDDFAGALSSAIEGRGGAVQRTADGKEGLKIAESESIDAIVLCVELPKMSGYAVCNKLKKNNSLKEIPLIITSSEATPKTFEQHKKLKTRAEEYVIKPCEPDEVVEKLHQLVGLEDGDGIEVSDDLDIIDGALDALEMDDDEGATRILSEDEIEDDLDEIALDALEVTDSQVEEVDTADLAIDSLGDDDIASFEDDDEFESLEDEDSAEAAIDALGDLGDDDDSSADMDSFDAGPTDASASLGAVGAAASARLASLEDELARMRKENAELESKLAEVEDDLRSKTNELEAFRSGGGGGSNKDMIRLKGEITQRDKEILSLKETLNEKEKAALEWQERENELEMKAAELEDEKLQNEANVKTLTEKVDAQTERLEKLQAELEQAREEGRRIGELEMQVGELSGERDGLANQVTELGARVAESAQQASDAQARLGELESRAEQAEGELESVRKELESVGSETDTLREQIQTLESENQKNEDRLLKAYQKLKGDEKLRENIRKAMNVALELLDTAPGDVVDDGEGAETISDDDIEDMALDSLEA